MQPTDQHAIGRGIERGTQLGQQGFQVALNRLASAAIDHADQQQLVWPLRVKRHNLALDRHQLAIVPQHAAHGMDAAGQLLGTLGPETVVLRSSSKTLDRCPDQRGTRPPNQLGSTLVGKDNGARARIHQPDGFLQSVECRLPETLLGACAHVLSPATPWFTALSKK